MFYKHNFECYNANDFKIVRFTEQENELLQDSVKKLEELCLLLPHPDAEGNWIIDSANMKEALQFCDNMLKSCAESEATSIKKLRNIFEFAEENSKPVHFFTDDAMSLILNKKMENV